MRIGAKDRYAGRVGTWGGWVGIFVAYVSIEKIISKHLFNLKVSTRRHPVLLGMAKLSLRTECMSNQGCRIYKITGKITKKHCSLAGHN